MSQFADVVRSFWAPGLNNISGNTVKGIKGWLTDEKFQIYAPAKADTFATSVSDTTPFLSALASDINRTAAAAYETISQAKKDETLPRSSAWIVIKSYYAAYFAAHAVSRMLGRGFTNLEPPQIGAINRILTVFGSGAVVRTGNFAFQFRSTARDIQWTRIDASSGGVHESFWKHFLQLLEVLADDILKSKTGIGADNQQVGMKLIEAIECLKHSSCDKGNWLSVVRNRVNYRQELGAWYPYRDQAMSGTTDERLTKTWLLDPMAIDLSEKGQKDVRRFQNMCSFL